MLMIPLYFHRSTSGSLYGLQQQQQQQQQQQHSSSNNGGSSTATGGNNGNNSASGGKTDTQTEPVDFSSSNPPLSFTSPGSAFGRSGSTSADLSRFRSNAAAAAGYSSFAGLSSTYNSLLQNGYSSAAGYHPSAYNQSAAAAAGYSCLNYATSAFPSASDAAANFGLSSSLLSGGSQSGSSKYG